jgi:hypothetical protein
MNKSLAEIFFERVIRIDAVQRERTEAVTVSVAQQVHGKHKKGKRNIEWREVGKAINDRAECFFRYGLVPGTASPLWPVEMAPTPFPNEVEGFQMAPAMLRAWEAAIRQWVALCVELAEGRLIAEGNDLFDAGRHGEIDPRAWLSDGLWVDVHASAVYATKSHGYWLGSELVKSVENVTVRTATPKQKPGRIGGSGWDYEWTYDTIRRANNQLPPEDEYLAEAEARIPLRCEHRELRRAYAFQGCALSRRSRAAQKHKAQIADSVWFSGFVWFCSIQNPDRTR